MVNYEFYNRVDVVRKPFLDQTVVRTSSGLIHGSELHRRRTSEICVELSGIIAANGSDFASNLTLEAPALCTGLMNHSGYSSS